MIKENLTVLSNWNHLVVGMQTSPTNFYNILKETISKHEIPGISFENIESSEAGILSAKRKYLRASRNAYIFDVCAAPFGKDFFFSWWYAKKNYSPIPASIIIFVVFALILIFKGPVALMITFPIFFFSVGLIAQRAKSQYFQYLLAVPILGWLWQYIFISDTYFQADTDTMYRTAFHNSVIEAIDIVLEHEKAPPLTPEQKKPILHDFYNKLAR